MLSKSKLVTKQPQSSQPPSIRAGLLVRTNLRAGLAWDDLDDQAKALWDQLTGAVSNAVSSVTGSTTSTTTS